jgi:hypothetical protein
LLSYFGQETEEALSATARECPHTAPGDGELLS